MLGSSRKSAASQLNFPSLSEWIKLFGEYTYNASEISWSEMLTQTQRLLPVSSLCLYQKKSSMALYSLLGHTGSLPLALSFSTASDFLGYLEAHAGTILRDVFAEDLFHELRKSALLFFQQTNSSGVMTLRFRGDHVGLLAFTLEANLSHPERQHALDGLALTGIWLAQSLSWEEQNLKKEKYAELSRVKNELLSNVTHELKTPISGILGLTEALLDGACGEASEEWRDVLVKLRELGLNLDRTVGGILDLVTIEARRFEAPKNRVALIPIIREAVANLDDHMKRKGNRFEFASTHEEYFVYGVTDQLQTVFLNLLGNACKFTENGCVGVQLEKSGERVRIKVWDNGIGIDPDQKELIFEEFFQGDGKHTRHFGGTGLGLAVVRKIITMHGGRIDVESTPGQGATFLFTLPLKPS